MSRFRSVLGLWAIVCLTATPAAAQVSSESRPGASLAPLRAPVNVAWDAAESGGETASGAQGAVAPGQGRSFQIRALGGLQTGYGNAGIFVTGGVGLRPFADRRIGIDIDGGYGRASDTYSYGFGSTSVSSSVIRVSGTGVYHFEQPDRTWVPFAGLGLDISKASVTYRSPDFDFPSGFPGVGYSGSSTAFGFRAGIQQDVPGGGRAWRFELRTGFYGFGASSVIIAGISF